LQSDWGAATNGTAAAIAGLDFVEGGNFAVNAIWANSSLSDLVSNKTIDIQNLNDKIVRVLTPYYALERMYRLPVFETIIH
jgi:beta-glucosidase